MVRKEEGVELIIDPTKVELAAEASQKAEVLRELGLEAQADDLQLQAEDHRNRQVKGAKIR